MQPATMDASKNQDGSIIARLLEFGEDRLQLASVLVSKRVVGNWRIVFREIGLEGSGQVIQQVEEGGDI